MDPTLLVGLIAASATIVAAIIGARANRKANKFRRADPNKSVQIETDNKSKSNQESKAVPSETDKTTKDIALSEKSETLELGGVLHVLQEHLLRRASEQLDPSVRRYETMQAVESGCKEVALKVTKDKFAPEVIIGWKDVENKYKGSEIVSNLIAKALKRPCRIINLTEESEKRRVAEDCLWFKNIKSALVVTDASYSGTTFKSIQAKLIDVNPRADIRFAVLSTLDPSQVPNLYYETVHKTEELLFPWGWSRLILGFYDIYKLFGITDRRTVEHEVAGWGNLYTLAKGFVGNVNLISIEANKENQVEANRDFDVFLYVLNGKVRIRVGNKSGIFKKGQYIFIPRTIGYTVSAPNTADILELSSDGKQSI